MIGKIVEKSRVSVLALVRMQEVRHFRVKFKMPKDMSPDSFFESCFGVFRPEDVKAEVIRLRAFADEMFYVESKPIHSSQKRLGHLDSSAPYCDFELYLKPTNDFIAYLLSRADRLKVLYPPSLRQQIKATLKKSVAMYN